MQNLEEKFDIMLQNQCEIQESIQKIRDVEINIFQTQGDILRTQYKMQEDIYNLKENQIKMQDDIAKLDRKIDDNYAKLDKKIDDNYAKLDEKIDENYEKLDRKIDDNYQKLDKKIDENYANLDEKIDKNALDTSGIFQDICAKLDELSNPKPRLTILK